MRSFSRTTWIRVGDLGKQCLVLALSLLTSLGIGADQTSTDAKIRSLQTHLKMYPTDFKA